MNQVTRELLLGYLMGELSPKDQTALESRLEDDADLRDELEQLGAALKPETEDNQPPPKSLFNDTLNLIDAYECELAPHQTAQNNTASDANEQHPTPVKPPPAVTPAADANLSSTGKLWHWTETTILGGVMLAASLLFFPAVVQSRFQSRVAFCQQNLTRVGFALKDYSENPKQEFPPIAAEGNLSFAGVYAPMLFEKGLLREPSVLICSSSPFADEVDDWQPPTIAQLTSCGGSELRALQRTSGGSYGYTMGYVCEGEYRATRNCNRTHYAIMTDAPDLQQPGRASSNHAGRGQNVLFEDLHVEFVNCCREVNCGDDFFFNHHGLPIAGADENDAVVGHSTASPLILNVSRRP